jgi:transposase
VSRVLVAVSRAQRQLPPARSPSARPPHRAAVNLHAAGLDVGAEAPDVAVPPRDAPHPGRRWGAATVDGAARAHGCARCGLTTVALASPGVSGRPLGELWEGRGCEVWRVEPPPGQPMKGRPNREVHAGPWRQRLQTVGLLAGAFRPPEPVCGRRRALRQRALWRTSASHHRPPRHKALTPRHRKRPQGVSAVTGATGLAMMRASLGGAREPGKVAPRRHDRCPHDEAPSATARCGQWRDEPRVALAPAVALEATDHAKLAAGARQRDAHRGTFADGQDREAWRPVTRPRHRRPVAVRGALPRMTGGARTAMEGLDAPTAVTLRRASGLAMGRGPTVQHGPAWLGLCPPPRVAGGQVFARRTKPCANRAATARRWAASCRPRSQSALGACCRRMQAR